MTLFKHFSGLEKVRVIEEAVQEHCGLELVFELQRLGARP